MKGRFTLAIAMVVVFTFAFAAVAYATWGDSGYAASSGDNPHVNYGTSTVKCAVCHAVHNATAGGTKLLQSAGGVDPCTYCHVSLTSAYTQVYNGQVALYNAASKNAHDMGGLAAGTTNYTSHVECRNCHTVHGAGYVTIGTPRNLRTLTGSAFFTAPTAPRSAYPATMSVSGATLTSVSQWCSGCHPYWNQGYDSRSHVMTAPTASKSYQGMGFEAAFVGSSECMSCHDSAQNGLVFGGVATTVGAAFPHYTAGARFMSIAAQSGGATSAATATNVDGACLKCHASANSGVGKLF